MNPFPKDEKGSMIYSVLGVIIILIISSIAMHIMVSSYTNTAKHAEQQKMINAINNIKGIIPNALRYSVYPSIWKAGHEMNDEGVNKYLTISSGREEIKESLKEDTADYFNAYMCNNSDKCTNNTFTWIIDDIEVKMKGITPGNIEVEEETTTKYLTFKIIIPEMSSGYRDIEYNETEINTAETIPIRLFEMYDKAKKFHENYEKNTQWATTIALYLRAYVNAYNPNYKGSFIKEGHIAYDPIDQIMRGDIESIEKLAKDPAALTDIGSVPISTWMSEWTYLGEPSFLPPGTDLNTKNINKSQIINTIKKGYDIESASNCSSSSLTGDERMECENFNNVTWLASKADDLNQERTELENLSTRIQEFKDWSSTGKTCDEYKEKAENIIEEVKNKFNAQQSKDYILDPAEKQSKGSEVEKDIKENEDVLNDAKDAVSNLTTLKDSRLSQISDSYCCCYSGDCSSCSISSDCAGECSKIECPEGTENYFCGENILGSRTTSCESTSCNEETGECTTKNWDESTDTCDCQCHPKSDLVNEIDSNLCIISEMINDRKDALEQQETEINKRAETLNESLSKLEEIENLENKSVETGFDVISRIDFEEVRFNPGDKNKCYLYPTWNERTNGTCGNKVKSVALYTAQVAAATVCCALSGACCPAIKYASEWFPAIYEVKGKYRINETIVDDENRIMLHNLGSSDGSLYGTPDDPKLYAHVAGEFQIYEDYEINASSKTGDVVLVYLYLPRLQPNPVDKVVSSFDDKTCTTKNC